METKQLPYLNCGIKDTTLKVIEEIHSKQTQKEKVACRANYGVRVTENPLLDLSIDLHK